ELEFVVAARVARLLGDRGDGKGALEIHGRVIETARRIGQPAIELEHQLGLAELGLDAGPSPRARRAIARAGELVERLSLTPPSPSLVRWWILSGRVAAIDGADETAADRWTAASTRRGPTGAPRWTGEAALRLAVADMARGDEAAARSRFDRPDVDRLVMADEAGGFAAWKGRLLELPREDLSGGAALARYRAPAGR
ncbi:MAG TPA: hypothetical protein VMH78_04745, partial [Thermoplasmata archaeon]|nr:hypothetical protein [Thermoplasmata archaeon]